jgi:hypothetical protein
MARTSPASTRFALPEGTEVVKRESNVGNVVMVVALPVTALAALVLLAASGWSW